MTVFEAEPRFGGHSHTVLSGTYREAKDVYPVAVKDKQADIAILRTLGARPGSVMQIFIVQGMLIGVIGTIFGLLIGYTLSYLGGHYHWISLSAEVYSIDYVPFAPRMIDGVIVAAVSLLISFLSTIYPATAAARIYPAEALRYE